MNGWELPTSIEIGGVLRRINADYRDILDVIARLNEQTSEAMYVCLCLFYEEMERISEDLYGEAVEKMLDFINCGEPQDSAPHPKVIDWEQDRQMIISDINKVAGCEVRSLKFCHWWTFIAWFNGIGEGQLATVVSIREKLRKGKKLDDWEKNFYRDNRSKVDLKSHYTDADDLQLSKWLGGGQQCPTERS